MLLHELGHTFRSALGNNDILDKMNGGNPVEYLMLGHLNSYYKDFENAKNYKDPLGFGFEKSDGTTSYMTLDGMLTIYLLDDQPLTLSNIDKELIQALTSGKWNTVASALSELTTENPFPASAILRRIGTSDMFVLKTGTSHSYEKISPPPSRPVNKSQTNDLFVEVDGKFQLRTDIVCRTIGGGGHCVRRI